MRKIRGFRLSLRVKDIERRARKACVDLAALGLGEAPALDAWLGRVSAAAAPAVLYDSFPADNGSTVSARKREPDADAMGPAQALELAPMPGLAFSLALATLGPDLDSLAERLAAEQPQSLALFNLASQAALEESVRFVGDLLEGEAAEERCSLSPLQYLDHREQLEAVLARLQGRKIGVALAETGLRPRHSTAFSVSWLARSRTRAKV